MGLCLLSSVQSFAPSRDHYFVVVVSRSEYDLLRLQQGRDTYDLP